jgi:hypothetical protein
MNRPRATQSAGGGGILVILTGYFSNVCFCCRCHRLLLLPPGAATGNAGHSANHQRCRENHVVVALALALVFMLPDPALDALPDSRQPALAVVIALYRRIGRILFSLTLAGSYDRFAGDGSDRPRRGAGKRKTHGFTAVLVFVSGAALACLAGIQEQFEPPAGRTVGLSVLFAGWVTIRSMANWPFQPETNARTCRPGSRCLF